MRRPIACSLPDSKVGRIRHLAKRSGHKISYVMELALDIGLDAAERLINAQCDMADIMRAEADIASVPPAENPLPPERRPSFEQVAGFVEAHLHKCLSEWKDVFGNGQGGRRKFALRL